jgi:signal transduction histidine kinase
MATSLQARNEERSRLMEQVESERATFGSIVTSMTQGVIMVDHEDRVRYFSGLAGRLLHLDPTAWIDRPVDEALRVVAARADGAGAVIPAWEALRSRIGDYPTFDIAAGASSQDLRLDCFPIILDGGDRSGFGILIRDVTAERDVSRAKDDLISIVSHELRTPLASIRSFSELLLTYDDPEVRQEFLGVINAESERLSRLLNETLDLAKIEAGTFDLNTSVFDPGPVLAECAKTYAPLAAQQKVDLVADDLSGLTPIAMNPDRLIQVVFNLLDNALKFTQAGEVRLGARQAGEELWITVSDTGVGIAAADLDRIFERFHQAGSVISGKPRGLGLGLSLCREIVHRYGGRIWAESQERRGSSFYVALPLAAPAALAGAASGVASAGS